MDGGSSSSEAAVGQGQEDHPSSPRVDQAPGRPALSSQTTSSQTPSQWLLSAPTPELGHQGVLASSRALWPSLAHQPKMLQSHTVAAPASVEMPLPLRLLSAEATDYRADREQQLDAYEELGAEAFTGGASSSSAYPVAGDASTTGPPLAARPGTGVSNVAQTTLMVRNIPLLYTQEMLATEWPNHGTYDFLYLPSSCNIHRNMSYCFINFTSEVAAAEFAARWHKRRLGYFQSKKPLTTSWAEIQGRDLNLWQLRKKWLRRAWIRQNMPLVFENGVQVPLNSAMERLVEAGVDLPDHGAASSSHGETGSPLVQQAPYYDASDGDTLPPIRLQL
mmetsp:Transcript_49026/g.116651  ORF Transcript_49026/g.116651 Transcript_49026/m.116651 type:complete len:334 (-) Transcript_49026:215-1216(-)